MTEERVYPSSKPPAPSAANVSVAGAAPKPQIYNPARQPYRPQPRYSQRPSRRRCSFCCCCFWSILIILILALVLATAGAALWLLYRPHRPDFSVSSLKISTLNLTTTSDSSSSTLVTSLNLTVSSRNPNKKLVYFYERFSVSVLASKVLLANSTFPAFASFSGNTTVMRFAPMRLTQDLDAELVKDLRSDLKKKKGLEIEVQMDTKVKVKMDGLKSDEVGIRITCEGIRGGAPKGKSPSVAVTTAAECKVDLRVKIWKFTF